jgi:HK97 family phage prohead protease
MSNKPQQPNRRIVFIDTAKLAVRRAKFDASGKESPDGQERTTLAGLAIPWNTLSGDKGGFQVRFLPNSATFATPTLALFHHDYKALLGSTANNTLRLSFDASGVSVEIDLPNTTTAADVAALIDGGYLSGMSFSMLFDDVLQSAEINENGATIMEVSKFTCDEITVTAIPSFDDTNIQIKSASDQSIDLPTQYSAAPERVGQSLKLEQLRLDAYQM